MQGLMFKALDEPLQDLIGPKDNPCFGCGPQNPEGFKIKSYPREGGGLVAEWTGGEHHAGSFSVMGGGVQATLIDCHGIWTAVDHVARDGMDPLPHFLTVAIDVGYRAKAPLGEPVTLTSEVVEVQGRRITAEVELTAPDGTLCSQGQVVCHRTDKPWGPNPYLEAR